MKVCNCGDNLNETGTITAQYDLIPDFHTSNRKTTKSGRTAHICMIVLYVHTNIVFHEK